MERGGALDQGAVRGRARAPVVMPVRAPDPDRISFLGAFSYAHRGLHGGAGDGGGRPENSMPAFAAALDAGYGMECDVRLSRDGIPFVFHDAALDRMTGETGPVAARTARELDGIALNHGGGPIPRLSALLDLVNGRVPVLIELKIDRHRDLRPLCRAVRHALACYRGPVAIMSFHPGAARWFHARAPEILRGLVVTDENRRGPLGLLARHLALRAAHPDFLAYDIRDLPNPFVRAMRRKGLPVLSWTVRSEQQWRTVEAEADAAIFEREPGED